MSRIFSTSEILGGSLPKPEDFVSAKNEALELGHDLVGSGDIVGLRVIGSAARGDFNYLLSDLDLIILSHPELHPTSLRNIRRCIADLTRRHGIPVQAIYTDGSPYLDCINLALISDNNRNPVLGNTVGEDPIQHMQFRHKSPIEAFRWFFEYKLKKVSNLTTNPDHPDYLQALSILMNLQKGVQIKSEGLQMCLAQTPNFSDALLGNRQAQNLNRLLIEQSQNYCDLITSIKLGKTEPEVYPTYYRQLGAMTYTLANKFLGLCTEILPNQLPTPSALEAA